MKNNSRKKLIIILLISLIGMGLGILIYVTTKQTFLFKKSDRYMDYFNSLKVTETVYAGIGGARSYFPFTYIILRVIKLFIANTYASYFITFGFACVFIIAVYLIFFKKFDLIGILLLTFLSYPTIYTFDRGNIEYILLALMFFFFLAYKKEKYKTAAIILAFPICMKLYPAIFILLFLYKRKIKELFICIISSVILMISSYCLLGGTLDTIPIAANNFKLFTNSYAKTNYGMQFSHTIWTGMNYINMKTNNINNFPLTTIYTIGIGIIAALLSIYVIFIEKEEWKVISILTIMMITFPHVSFDYTLINMYIPIAFFVMDKNTKKWEDIVYSILFALTIIPMNWFQSRYYDININIGLILRPIILMSIILIIILTNENKFDIKGFKKRGL